MPSSRLASLVALSALAAACGSSPSGPSTPTPRVTSITPTAGSTAGGTAVTISGASFAGGATVSIGGAAAAQVTVVDPATITAVVPAHGAGSADVVVTTGGQNLTLPGGFTYVSNAPPSIVSIAVKGSKPREPPQFADLDETVTVSATVTDAETPVSQLTFAWSAEAGAGGVRVPGRGLRASVAVTTYEGGTLKNHKRLAAAPAKCETNRGTSSSRSRSGGTPIGTTASRKYRS